MKHECKITVLETKVFPELQKNIWQTRSLGLVPSLKLGTPSCSSALRSRMIFTIS